MTLTYEECVALKEAGFPQKTKDLINEVEYRGVKYTKPTEPTLEELIEETRKDGDKLTFGYIKGFVGLELVRDGKEYRESGSTPIQAVAKLYLALKADRLPSS